MNNNRNCFLRPYKLFKVHEDSECENLLNLTRYLYSEGFNITPMNVQEKLFPSNITQLPTVIFTNGLTISSYSEIISYYEKLLEIIELESTVLEFIQKNNEYRIFDKSTHKKIVKVPLKKTL
jgi:hypothetical protein